MTYANYVAAAYAVFAVVLGWDFLSTRVQIIRHLRAAKRRESRDAARARPKRSMETQ
ncbi:heme exporter protein CcmD [Lysobacter sp. HA18]